MKRVVIAAIVSGLIVATGLLGKEVDALSLKVAPLEYRTELGVGEKKKGFIDVSNPTTQTIRVKATAEAFAQIDDNGTLRFYPEEQISAGVQLDLDEFDIGPRQAVRMYFQLDGAKLPSGDVFAAVLFTLDPKQPRTGVAQTIRLGTLLSIVNGTPGSREADITRLDVPFFHLSDTISGAYRIKNTAKAGSATGFYPEVKLNVQPFGDAKTQKGKLIFADRTRENSFSLKAPAFGLYQIKVTYRDSTKLQWIFVVHPAVLGGLMVGALVWGVAVRIRYRETLRPQSSQGSTAQTKRKWYNIANKRKG